MKILITGSGGMLGYDLCNVLSGEYYLTGIDIASSGNNERLNKFYQIDITQAEGLEKILLAENPDVVVHTAAWTDVDGCEQDTDKAEAVNVKGTLNIAEAAEKAGSYLMALSTDYVFDGAKGSSYTEKDRPNPLSVYGRTKLEAENIIKETLSSFVILRTSALYGGNGKNFVDTVISKAFKGEEIRIVADQVTSPTYTYDLAKSVKDVIEKRAALNDTILNICNSGSCSWYDFAVNILDKADIKYNDVKPITSAQLDRPAERPGFSVLDNTLLYEITGREMRSWKEALSDYLIKKQKRRM